MKPTPTVSGVPKATIFITTNFKKADQLIEYRIDNPESLRGLSVAGSMHAQYRRADSHASDFHRTGPVGANPGPERRSIKGI